jgi:uncharacterized protein involved in cysteine biosynthesis
MLAAFLLACQDTAAPAQRRALFFSLALAVLVLFGLWLGASLLLGVEHPFGTAWLDAPLTILGSLAALVLAWLLFPAMAAFVLGFFLDGLIARLERRHYPSLPAPGSMGWGDLVTSTLGLAGLTLALNLLFLPLYFWPGINFFIYYGLNGYLLGRQFFDLVAGRRLDRTARRMMWRRHRGRLTAAGVVIAFLMSLPLVNLAAPLLAASFMLHLVEGLRRRDGLATVRGRIGV